MLSISRINHNTLLTHILTHVKRFYVFFQLYRNIFDFIFEYCIIFYSYYLAVNSLRLDKHNRMPFFGGIHEHESFTH
jgi:hypothetical protein